VASQLFERFGTLVNVLRQAQTGDVLKTMVGKEIADRLVYLGASLDESLRDEAIEELQLGSLEAVIQYLKSGLVGQDREMFRCLFLGGENQLIDDRIMWVGTVDRVQAHPRELVRAALSLGAVAALVAHNHVSAAARPSSEDLRFTAKLVNAFAPFDLRLNDHIIVGRDGCYSMRAAGVLNKIEERGRLASDASELVA
jgi:DNA repair protein RadC